MQHLSDPLFRLVFDQLTEPRLILKPEAPTYVVVAVNKAYSLATGYKLEELSGRSIWDFFKPDAAGSSSAEKFRHGLDDVLRHRTAMRLPIFRYDALNAGAIAPRWWQVEITPVTNAEEEISYLVCTTHNVTIHVQDQAAIMQGRQNEAALLVQQQHTERELLSSEKALRQFEDDNEYRLKRVIANTPAGLCILKGSNFVIEMINLPLLRLWGRKEADIITKPLLDAFPEFKEQPFPTLIEQVLQTGKPVKIPQEIVIIIERDGQPKNVFSDFSLDPLFDLNRDVEAVLVTVSDVTEMVNTRKLLEERQKELEAINEEMTAANEELVELSRRLGK